MTKPKKEDLYTVGTVAKIKQMVKMPKDMLRVLVEGKFRAHLDEMVQEKPFMLAEVTIYAEEHQMDVFEKKRWYVACKKKSTNFQEAVS